MLRRRGEIGRLLHGQLFTYFLKMRSPKHRSDAHHYETITTTHRTQGIIQTGFFYPVTFQESPHHSYIGWRKDCCFKTQTWLMTHLYWASFREQGGISSAKARSLINSLRGKLINISHRVNQLLLTAPALVTASEVYKDNYIIVY